MRRHDAPLTLSAMSIAPLIIDIIGWIAAALILGSYILLSLGRLEGRSRRFQWLNVVGAGGFIINSGYHGAIPSAALNIVWMAMGLFTLAQLERASSRQAD